MVHLNIFNKIKDKATLDKLVMLEGCDASFQRVQGTKVSIQGAVAHLNCNQAG